MQEDRANPEQTSSKPWPRWQAVDHALLLFTLLGLSRVAEGSERASRAEGDLKSVII